MNKGILSLLLVVLLTGCTATQKGAAVGATGGAVLGGIIGHQSDHGGTGAAIGAAVGGITGAVVADKMQTKFCPKCGATYTSSTEFCSKDGTELKDKEK